LAGQVTVYQFLSELDLLSFAQADLGAFLDLDDRRLVIDRGQRAPQLIVPMKMQVDRDTQTWSASQHGEGRFCRFEIALRSAEGSVSKESFITAGAGGNCVGASTPSRNNRARRQECARAVVQVAKVNTYSISARFVFPSSQYYIPFQSA
jgi:hypothetical protein